MRGALVLGAVAGAALAARVAYADIVVAAASNSSVTVYRVSATRVAKLYTVKQEVIGNSDWGFSDAHTLWFFHWTGDGPNYVLVKYVDGKQDKAGSRALKDIRGNPRLAITTTKQIWLVGTTFTRIDGERPEVAPAAPADIIDDRQVFLPALAKPPAGYTTKKLPHSGEYGGMVDAVLCKGPSDRRALWSHPYVTAETLEWISESPVVLRIEGRNTSPHPTMPFELDDPAPQAGGDVKATPATPAAPAPPRAPAYESATGYIVDCRLVAHELVVLRDGLSASLDRNKDVWTIWHGGNVIGTLKGNDLKPAP